MPIAAKAQRNRDERAYAPRMTACPGCGTDAGDSAKFCPECGTRIVHAEPGGETRKIVTVVFCDVVGSTALGERLDPEAQRGMITRYFAEMRRVLESHGGRVEKFIGDAVMAVFGVPVVHEDDALRAARAAAGMQEALAVLARELAATYGVELAARIGVNTGEVVVGDGERGTVATGDAVNTAARLEQAASAGEVLLGETTHRLLRGLVEAEEVPAVDAKGKGEPVRAWRLLSAPEGTGRISAVDVDVDVAFVGRERELRLLRAAYDGAVEENICQLVTVLGVAGTGKTRLIHEFLSRLPVPPTVLEGRCLSYGEGIAFWPLLEMLRSAAGLHGGEPADEARERLAALLPDEPNRGVVIDRLAPLAGLPGRAAGVDETQSAVRRMLQALARTRPVVLVVDDVHWAEPALLELLDNVVNLLRDVPVVVVCLARPDFLENRPGWAADALNATTLNLSPLSEADVAGLVGELLAGSPVDPDVVSAVAVASGGNALFVGQLLAMLRDDGRIRLLDGVWSVVEPLARLDLPPSISALLTARLERLPAEERQVLEAASVMGAVFYAGALMDLMDPAPEQPPTAELTRLLRRDLLREAESDIAGEEGYRFLHVLVREAAYATLPKAVRATLHQRFAAWLDDRAGHATSDLDEFVGYHLEQAFLLRRELGPVDDETVAMGAAAAGRLERSAARCHTIDPRGSSSLFARAAALVEEPRRDWLELRAARSLYAAGDLTGSLALGDRVLARATARGDERLATIARLDRTYCADQLGQVAAPEELLRLTADVEHRFDPGTDPEVFAVVELARVTAFNVLARWQQVV